MTVQYSEWKRKLKELPITYRGNVYPRDCDHMGHMNVTSYMEKFDNATWNFFTDNGLSREFLKSQGIGLAAVNQNITYKRELQPGDTITIRSDLLKLEGKKIKFRSIMYLGNTNEVVAELENLAVCLDMQKRRACNFPNEILEKSRINLPDKRE